MHLNRPEINNEIPNFQLLITLQDELEIKESMKFSF